MRFDEALKAFRLGKTVEHRDGYIIGLRDGRPVIITNHGTPKETIESPTKDHILNDEWRVQPKTGNFLEAVSCVHGGGTAWASGLPKRKIYVEDGKVYVNDRSVVNRGPVTLADIGSVWVLE